MENKIILDKIPSLEHPVGLGGCRAEKINHVCCDYNVVIFDNTDLDDSIVELENEFVRLHHANLNESRIEVLSQYQNLQIINDPKW